MVRPFVQTARTVSETRRTDSAVDRAAFSNLIYVSVQWKVTVYKLYNEDNIH